MSTIYKTFAMAMTAMLMIVACSNTRANNEDKKEKNSKETVQPAKAKELTEADFNKLVYNTSLNELKYLGDKPAIVDFTAKWCGPCQRIAPVLDELAKEYEDKIVVYKVDIDKCQKLAQTFGISSVPAILYIPLDKEPSMTIGSRDKAKFQKEIDTILLGK